MSLRRRPRPGASTDKHEGENSQEQVGWGVDDGPTR